MKIIESKILSLSTFQDNIERYMEDITKSIEEQIVDINVEQQYSGLRSDGESIRPPYAESTKRRKKRKGQPTDRVTLRDTGQYHASFAMSYEPDSFSIYAQDFKAKYLVHRYTTKIYGIQDEYLKALAEEIYQPRLVERLRKQL